MTQYVGKYEKHSGTDHAQLPLPEPSDVSQAAAVDFDDLQRELNRLRTTLEGFFDLTNVKYNIVTCLWSNWNSWKRSRGFLTAVIKVL